MSDRAADSLAILIRPLILFVNRVGTVSPLLMVFLLGLNTGLSYLLGKPLIGSVELEEFMLIVPVCSGLAYTAVAFFSVVFQLDLDYIHLIGLPSYPPGRYGTYFSWILNFFSRTWKFLNFDTRDIDVYPQYATRLSDGLIQADREFYVMIYPDQPHRLRGKSFIHMEKRYFVVHLRPKKLLRDIKF